jgi:hypothetical protein
MPDPNRLPRGSAPNRAREPSQRRASRESSQQHRRIHPALKHGGYSGMSLLPGEDPAEFKKVHEELVAEYAPTGQHEREIVETIARLMWRKRCLWTYGLAEFARRRYSEIVLEKDKAAATRSRKFPKMYEHSLKVEKALELKAAEKGRPPSDEEIEQIKAQHADADAEAEREYVDLMIKLMQHPKERERYAQAQIEQDQVRREMGAVAFELARMPHVATTGYLMHELSIIDRIDGMIDRCLKRLLLVRGVKSISPSLSKATPKQIASS